MNDDGLISKISDFFDGSELGCFVEERNEKRLDEHTDEHRGGRVKNAVEKVIRCADDFCGKRGRERAGRKWNGKCIVCIYNG